MDTHNKIKVLHWPTSYPDPNRNEPYNCIFIEEHIRSTIPFCSNKVLFVSPHSTKSEQWHERIDSVENGIGVTRYYFNQNLNLQLLNIYIRLIIFGYFIDLILFKRFYPNIVHLHFFPAGEWASIFAKLFQIKTVVTEHWTALIGYPIISAKRFKTAKRVYEQAAFVLPVSSHLGQGIIQNTNANIKHKMQVIHNCVDTQLFHIATPSSHIKFQMMTVARLEEQKDIPTMLRAFEMVKRHLPEATLSIIGGGDSRQLIQLACDLKINDAVQFLGAQPKTFIAQKMQASDLFILSSISENSPCVIGEAHCCGVPVVATDVGGIKELIIEGGVVPARSPELLAQKILEQLKKKTDRKELAQKAQERFGYTAIGQQIVNIYRKVCAE